MLQRPSVALYDEGQSSSQYEHIEARGPKNLQELPFEASDKHALACVEGNQIVVFEKNIPEKVSVEVIHDKQNEDQVMLIIPTASENVAQCLNCDGLSPSMKVNIKEFITG